ncbi:MAG: hypothetical protein PVI01_10000 [Gemmatimonadales bacterium]|jgi:hypothetical protein
MSNAVTEALAFDQPDNAWTSARCCEGLKEAVWFRETFEESQSYADEKLKTQSSSELGSMHVRRS